MDRAYVAEALHSILHQTYAAFEVIVVDDGSTDSTLEIVRTVADTDARVRVYQNPDRRGIPGNWNALCGFRPWPVRVCVPPRRRDVARQSGPQDGRV